MARVFTIVGRQGTVVCLDSQKNENGNFGYQKRQDKDTSLSAIKALNLVLLSIPEDYKFNAPFTFLMPATVNFLNYQDTREYWLKNGKTKSGKKISPELLSEIQIMHDQLAKYGKNVVLFGQKGIKSTVYQYFIQGAWDLLKVAEEDFKREKEQQEQQA